MSVTCVLGVCLFFEKVYPMVLGWVDEVGDKSWWGQVSCSHYLNEECKEGHGRWCFSFPFSRYCWRGASSDADILKLGCFRNGRCGREAWKETESSSGSFLSVMVLEDLICPLCSRSITWVQSKLFGPSSCQLSFCLPEGLWAYSHYVCHSKVKFRSQVACWEVLWFVPLPPWQAWTGFCNAMNTTSHSTKG